MVLFVITLKVSQISKLCLRPKLELWKYALSKL